LKQDVPKVHVRNDSKVVPRTVELEIESEKRNLNGSSNLNDDRETPISRVAKL